jgi:uncharacterized membrane protein
MSRADRWLVPALLAWTGLFVWLFAWIVWLAPPEPALRAPALLIALGPMVWFHRGMLAGRPRTHAAVSVLACLYVAHGAFELMVASVPVWLAGVETLLAALLLLTTAFHARTRGRADRGL